MRASRRAVLAPVLMALLATACSTGPSPGEAAPYVLVLQTADMPDGLSVVSPAVLGLRLALHDTPIGMQVVTGNPDAAVARAVDADEVLAVVVAPFTVIGRPATEALVGARIPVLSFSMLDAAPARPDASWRRFVPEADQMVDAMVREAVVLGRSTCLLAAPDPWAAQIGARLEVATSGISLFHAEVTPAGCDAAIWSGPAAHAASVRSGLSGPLLLTDQARTDGFLEATGPASGAATSGFCGCADLTTTADPEQQAFLHAYQEATGLDPGPFAAEGFDAGTAIVTALAGSQPSRESSAEALATVTRFDGLAGMYTWDEEGELATPIVRIYRTEGVRWLPVGGGW